MKIICLVKIIPDVEHFTYDYEKNILVRENQKSLLNPDDACAVAAALNLKKRYGANVTIVSMGPVSNRKYLEDLVRRGAERAVLLADTLYRGSDTYATSRILAKGVEKYEPDLILCGVRSMDGDTSHVPSQVAELLDMNIMSGVVKIREEEEPVRTIQIETEDDERHMTFALRFPAVLGITKESGYKLPFARYEDRKKDVSEQIHVLSNLDLGFREAETGLAGSKTKVVRTYPKAFAQEKKRTVRTDEAGIEYVYQFLKEKGFVRDDSNTCFS